MVFKYCDRISSDQNTRITGCGKSPWTTLKCNISVNSK